jgi:hypothetical protein
MALSDVKLTGKLDSRNDAGSMASITVTAAGGTFPDQIEALGSKLGQEEAISTAVKGGLAGVPTIRKVETAAFPINSEGQPYESGKNQTISHYAITFTVAGLI